jgi:hypothetical protein
MDILYRRKNLRLYRKMAATCAESMLGAIEFL